MTSDDPPIVGRRLGRDLWRGVEAQHRVATIKLADDPAEQEVLEQLLESSKPPLPAEAAGLHYLLATPFRYRSRHPSRFRAPGDPGLWYGAETLQTACAEVGYWRWRFVVDSEGLREREVVSEHTFFQARVDGLALDLTRAPWSRQRARWTHDRDYGPCQALARDARAAAIQWIRYESRRDPAGVCGAVLDPRCLSLPTPLPQQSWVCKAGASRVLMQHDRDRLLLQFDAPAAG